MKKWDAGSIILWLGHGMYDKTLGPCLVVNESQSDPNKYEDDCRNDRVVFTKNDYCAVTSKFFDQYYKSGSLKGSLIWLGACDSIRDNRLADVLLSKGASTVIGNDNPAFIPRLIYMTNEFFDNLLDGHDAGTALKLAQAQIDIKELGDAFSFANGGDLKITQLVLRGSDTWKLVIGASITGYVVDKNNKPISGAIVRIVDTDIKATTASDGSYTLFGAATNQSLSIKAEAKGYASQTQTVAVGASRGNANFALQESGRIKLRITADSDGWTRVYNGEQLTKALEANRNIKLMADVSDVEDVTEYSGILDGNGHTVANPQQTPLSPCIGWIGQLKNCTIKNLKIADVNQDTDAKMYIGLIGKTSGACTIDNCIILSGQISNRHSYPSAGAFVGIATGNLTMKNCVNMASVSAINNYITCSYASGMIGAYGAESSTDYTTTVDISNCLNLGSIYAEAGRTGSAIASGISSSYNDNSNVDITITNCGNGGEISAKHRETSSYAVASALSPQYSGVSGYATQKYNNDSNKNYLSIVSRDKLLSMWSDVLN